MKLFPSGHATHPQWPMAANLAVAQLRAQMALPEFADAPRLGLLYITDHYAPEAQAILDHLRQELPGVTDWAGCTGVGIAASGAEYWDEPALAILLCDLPPEQYQVFSGLAPLPARWQAQTALVHAEPQTPELAELIDELAQRTTSGALMGGLVSSRQQSVQFAFKSDAASGGGVLEGGLSGVAFGPGATCLTRVTQGCLPVAGEHHITRADQHVILELDAEPALDVMLRELDITLDEPQRAIAVVRSTLVGLSRPGDAAVGRTGHLQQDVRVRHIVGLDPLRQGVAVAEYLESGMRVAFCQRDAKAARADLVRICAEIREALEPESLSLESALLHSPEPTQTLPVAGQRIAGAVFISCTGRGGGHFGGPSAEMQIIRHALGDVPLVGFYAAGEIAANQLYGYTGVLTVFVSD